MQPDFTANYKDSLALASRQTKQQNRIRVLKQTYKHTENSTKNHKLIVILNQDVIAKQWRKASLFNKCGWNYWTFIRNNLSFNPSLPPHIKINSQWTMDLNTNPKTSKRNIKENPCDTVLVCYGISECHELGGLTETECLTVLGAKKSQDQGVSRLVFFSEG